MKKITFMLIAALLTLSCASNKKNLESSNQKQPQAEVPIPPEHIEAKLLVSEIADVDGTKTISATIQKVLAYGSATDPVSPNTKIQFLYPNHLSDAARKKLKRGAEIDAVITRSGNKAMLGNEKPRFNWELISIK